MSELDRYLALLSEAGPELEDQLVREVCEDSLYEFLKEAWPVFDPAPFVGGWHLEAIAEHLQAVTDGQIKKLLINVRPRSGKTGLVAVAWPCWTWALAQNPDRPLRGAGVRFLFGSYGANKAQGDGVTARRLIGSNWYQRLWGDRVTIAPDRDNQEQYDTLSGGSRISTGIPESLGKGGIIRCLDDPHKTDEIESEKVTAQVLRNYKEIWETRSNDPNNGAEVMIMQRQGECLLPGVKVRSPEGSVAIEKLSVGDVVYGSRGWQPVLATKQSGFSGRAFGIRLFGHPEVCWTTPSHEYKTRRGWVKAADVGLDDWIFFQPTPAEKQNVPWPDERLAPPPKAFTGTFLGKFERWRNPTVKEDEIRNLAADGATNVAIATRLGVHRNTVHNYMIHFGISRQIDHNRFVGRDHLGDPDFWRLIGYWVAEGSFCGGRAGKPGGVSLAFGSHESEIIADAIAIATKYGLSAQTENRPSVIQFKIHSVQLGVWLKEHFNGGARTKRIPEFVFSLDAECRRGLLLGWLLGDGCIRSRSRQVAGTSTSWALLHGFQRISLSLGMECGLMKGSGPGVSILNHPTRGALTVRSHGGSGELRLAKTTGVKSRYKCQFDEEGTWYRVKTIEEHDYNGPVYDISTPSHDFVVGNATVHNSDLSGYWLEKGGRDLVHLCIPAWYEDDRKCVTYVNGFQFWEDPRTVDGETFWPERYGPQQRAVDEGLGDFAFCTPAESPVLMADLSLRPIGKIVVGDEVIGFERPDAESHTGEQRRNILVRSKVLAISRSVQSVVKITLDSGETARCTKDHKWYRRARGPNRPQYLPAEIGAPLARVCSPRMPSAEPGQERLAGWLSGFFDGEGSLSNARRADPGRLGNFSSTSVISFAQGAGRNLPLCEKLETTLTEFGFTFNYHSDWRKENARDPLCKKRYECRQYYLTGKCLDVFQRFLHVIQPVKWRDRFIESAMRGKFIRGYERVVSIEPDGEEEVYGLTTTTGNYVVWGLASSNSGQIQQRPAPRGGGIIRREWWQPWPPDEAIERWTNSQGQVSYPPWEFVLAYLDTAFTKKETNDWCAMARLGVFGDEAGRPRVMLAGAWRERLNFRELVEKTSKTCTDGKVDVLVIENKAGGSWVAEEIIKEMRNGAWQVVLDTPTVDKVTRAHAVVPLFLDKMVHAPFLHEAGVWRAWAEMAIAEIETFPRGRHDDIVDAVVGALGYLRRNDLIKLSVEFDEDERDARTFRGNRGGVANLYGVG